MDADLAEAWSPQGAALIDHLEGRRPAVVSVLATGGEPEEVDAAVFFRPPESMATWETTALGLCGDRVLDVGAGAGCHSLALQLRGARVTALDTCPACVEVMQRRGVVDARLGPVAQVEDGPFDSLLYLMHGIGVVGDREGLRWMLADAHRLVSPGGSILLDSRDPGSSCNDDEGFGVAELAITYRGSRGAAFSWLFVSAAALARESAPVGWRTDVVCTEPDGRYLAQLIRS